MPNRSAQDLVGLTDMRVPFTLVVICGAMSGSATLLPVDAADFLDQGLADPIDPIDLVAPPVVIPSAPVKATLIQSDVEEAKDTAAAMTVVPPPKIKTVPSVVRVMSGEASWSVSYTHLTLPTKA